MMPNLNDDMARALADIQRRLLAEGMDRNFRGYCTVDINLYKDPNPPAPPGTIDVTFEEITDS